MRDTDRLLARMQVLSKARLRVCAGPVQDEVVSQFRDHLAQAGASGSHGVLAGS